MVFFVAGNHPSNTTTAPRTCCRDEAQVMRYGRMMDQSICNHCFAIICLTGKRKKRVRKHESDREDESPRAVSVSNE